MWVRSGGRLLSVATSPDYDSWGGRAGIAYRKGGSYVAVGAVYEKFTDYT